MQDFKELSYDIVNSLKKHGFTDAECYIKHKDTTEANCFQGDVSLLRSFPTDSITIKGLKGKKAVSETVLSLDKSSIDNTIENCVNKLKLCTDNEYEDITSIPIKKDFLKGPEHPDVDSMIDTLVQIVNNEDKNNKNEDAYIINHININETYVNSNGIELSSKLGYYAGAGGELRNCYTTDIKNGFSSVGKFELPYDKKIQNMDIKPLDDKFEGSIVFAPRFAWLYWWLSTISLFTTENSLGIDGCAKHKWADKLNQKVAASSFSISNMPLNPVFCNASPFTKEGFILDNTDIVKDGIYKNIICSKGNYARMSNSKVNINTIDDNGYDLLKPNIYIKPGDKSIKDIISGIKKGIIVFSLPGAIPYPPEENFSGIIRNGLLIEDGEVIRPVSEVMASGNYYDLQQNICGISKEYVFFGGDSAPWIAFNGVSFK